MEAGSGESGKLRTGLQKAGGGGWGLGAEPGKGAAAGSPNQGGHGPRGNGLES